MHLRLFLGRLSVLLKRSNWLFKIAITCILILSIVTLWWFCLEREIIAYNQATISQISDLSNQKIILDQVFIEYNDLNYKVANKKNNHNGLSDPNNDCYKIMDQAKSANLFLQSCVTKKNKDNHKQTTFNFFSNYQELLNFLLNLDQANICASCQRLKISVSGHRLQIAYVCGIHTSVK